MSKRVWRAGVLFSCPSCGLLWRDDPDHAEPFVAPCPKCGGSLGLVGLGEHLVENAKWFRCADCRELFMWRRQELVLTKPRTGFDHFA